MNNADTLPLQPQKCRLPTLLYYNAVAVSINYSIAVSLIN